jgi:hypothetical protein
VTEQDSTAIRLNDGYDQPTLVDDLQIAFPADLGDLLPPYESIPDDFRNERGVARKWVEFQRQWFSNGISRSALKPNGDVDFDEALRHLQVIQGSFEPKHQHKMAAVAWLASRWFADVEVGGR